MNERIKELAGQSVVRFDKDMDGSMVSEEHGRWIRYEDLEKFAELIVKECANHCDLLLDHKISSEWSRGTHDCSKAIKKHFGVE